MWKTQRLTANGWEPEHEFPSEADARKCWDALIELNCRAPLRLVDDRGVVVAVMNTGRDA